MSIPNLGIEVPLTPTLDVATLNVLIRNLKKSLGPLGKDIQLLDAKKVNDEVRKVKSQLSGIDDSFKAAFNAGSVDEMREHVQALLDQLDDFEGKGGDGGFADKYFKFEALSQGADLLTGIAEKSGDTRTAMKNLGVQTGLTGAELEKLKGLAGDLFERGGFASMGDAIQAIGTAKQQLGEFLDDKGLVHFTSTAQGIANVFDKDVNEVLGKSRTFISSFGLDGQEAANLVTLGMQQAGSGMDDFLDSLDEYSQLARDAGLSAEEFVGILINGIKAGTRDTDKLADSIKESGLRIRQGDAAKALGDIQANVARTLEGIVAAGQSGKQTITETMRQAATEIDKAFNAGQIDDSVRQQLQVAVSGTQAEDIGTELWGKIFSAPIDTNAIKAQAEQAGEQIKNSIEPKGLLANLEKKVERVFGDLAGLMSAAIGPSAQLATVIGQIGPGMEAMKTSERVADMKEWGSSILSAAKNLFLSTTATGAQTAATGAQTGVTVAATGATTALNIAMRALPILALIGGVTALIAIMGGFSKSTDEVIEDLDEVKDKAKEAIDSAKKTLSEIETSNKSASSVKALATELESLKGKSDPESVARYAEVSKQLADIAPETANGVRLVRDDLGNLVEVANIATTSVKAFADNTLQANAALKQGAIAEVQLELRELADAGQDAEDELESLKRKKEELNKAVALRVESGLDVSGFQEELLEIDRDIGKITVASQQNAAAQKETVKYLREQGVSQEEILKSQGKSALAAKAMTLVTEATDRAMEEVAQSTAEADKNAAKAAGSTAKIGQAAQRTEGLVKKVAEAYDKIRQAADDSYSSAFNGVLGLREKQRGFINDIKLAQIELKKLEGSSILDLQAQTRIAQLKSEITVKQEQIQTLKTLEQEEIQAAKVALQERRRLEIEAKRLQLQVGEIDFSVTDFGDQADKIRQEIDNVLFGIVNESVADEVQKRVDQVKQNLKNELISIDDQIKQVRAKVAEAASDGDPATVTKNSEALLTQLNRLKEVKEFEANEEIKRIQIEAQQNQLDQLRKYLDDQDALIDAAIDRRIVRLTRESEQIKVVDEKSYSEALAKRQEIIELQQTKEINTFLKSNDLYIRAQAEVQQARRDLDKASTAEETAAAEARFTAAQNETVRIRNLLIEQSDENREAIKALLVADPELVRLQEMRRQVEEQISTVSDTTQKTILENQKTELNSRIDAQEEYLDQLYEQTVNGYDALAAIEEGGRAQETQAQEELGAQLYDQRAAQLERELELEQRSAEKKAQVIQSLLEKVNAGLSAGFSFAIDQELNAKLEDLERVQEQELLSEEAFQQKKLELEEEAEKKRTILKAQEEGARLILEREAAAESLRQTEKMLQKKLELAESLGQTEAAKEIQLELATVQSELTDRGNEIVDLMGGLSEQLGEAAGEFFSGGTEQAKESFREYFAGLAAGLKQMLSAKITQVLLSLIGSGGLAGVIASFALKPVVTALVGGFATPIINNLLSFPTGGRLDSPTLFLAGDGSRLGGKDREWMFRDEQLRMLIAAILHASNDTVVEELQEMKDILRAWPTALKASGKDMTLVTERNRNAQQRRVRGLRKKTGIG